MPFSDGFEKLPLPPVRRFKRARDRLDRDRLPADCRAPGEADKDAGDLLSMLLLAQDEDGEAGA